MAINSHLCSFCSQKKSTVAIGLDGKLPTKLLKEAKIAKGATDMIEKWDRPTRYLCFSCMWSQIPQARLGQFEIKREGKMPIAIPKSTAIIFWQNEVHIPINLIWADKHYDAWLPVGKYDFIRIDELKKPKRKRESKKAPTPMFGDMTNGMMDFNESQGHQKK
jgi:hypothetical protein